MSAVNTFGGTCRRDENLVMSLPFLMTKESGARTRAAPITQPTSTGPTPGISHPSPSAVPPQDEAPRGRRPDCASRIDTLCPRLGPRRACIRNVDRSPPSTKASRLRPAAYASLRLVLEPRLAGRRRSVAPPFSIADLHCDHPPRACGRAVPPTSRRHRSRCRHFPLAMLTLRLRPSLFDQPARACILSAARSLLRDRQQGLNHRGQGSFVAAPARSAVPTRPEPPLRVQPAPCSVRRSSFLRGFDRIAHLHPHRHRAVSAIDPAAGARSRLWRFGDTPLAVPGQHAVDDWTD